MNFKMFDVNDLPSELLLTTRQKTELINEFNNNMSTNLKLSKTQISKIIQSRGFLGSLLSKLLIYSLMKLAVPLANNILVPLQITAAASALDARIQKKIHDSGCPPSTMKVGSGTTTLIISNKDINEIIKMVQVLDDSNILLKGVTETITNENKEQRGGLLGTLVGTLGSILLESVLPGKGIVRAGYGKEWDF